MPTKYPVACYINTFRKHDGFRLRVRGQGSDMYKSWVDAWENTKRYLGLMSDEQPGYSVLILDGGWVDMDAIRESGRVLAARLQEAA